jgi:phosphoglucomutase
LSLLDYRNSIYAKYGYFREALLSGTFKGQKGLETMGNLMKKLRNNPPAEIAGITVARVRDYSKGAELNGIQLPPSDVLQFVLEDGSMVTARPSGTEPKIKFYISCRDVPGRNLQEARETVDKKVEAIEAVIKKVIESAD